MNIISPEIRDFACHGSIRLVKSVSKNQFSYNIPPLLGRPKKSSNFFFTEWGFPGGQIVPTTCRSILHPSRASQRPYRAKNMFFGILGFSLKKEITVCPSNGRPWEKDCILRIERHVTCSLDLVSC